MKKTIGILWITLLLSLTFAAVYSIYADFIPSIEYLGAMNNVSYLLAFIMSIPFFVAIIRPSTASSEIYYQIKYKWVLFPLLIIVMALMVRSGFLKGMPPLLHHLANKKGSNLTLVVSNKIEPYHYPRCFGGIYSSYPIIETVRVCGLNLNDWRSTEIGDKIILHGNQTIFGFAYNNYTLIKVNQ